VGEGDEVNFNRAEGTTPVAGAGENAGQQRRPGGGGRRRRSGRRPGSGSGSGAPQSGGNS
jgi:polyribonucleotide nucleotidyltransferase